MAHAGHLRRARTFARIVDDKAIKLDDLLPCRSNLRGLRRHLALFREGNLSCLWGGKEAGIG